MERPEYLNKNIVVFDGYCNLCSAWVIFIIKREKGDSFRFIPLSSPVVDEIKQHTGIERIDTRSIALIRDNRLYQKSDAVLLIVRDLKGLWPLFYGFRIVPVEWRDKLYDFIARNRYRWFGRKDQCMVPGPSVRNKFLDMK